jgi:hypothetical protein
MSKIPKHVSGSHDQAVRKLASQLKNEGWQVKVDLPNRRQPDPVGKDGRIPDIQATKRGRTKLVEIETPSTVNSHKQQASTFRRSAAQKKNTSFDLVIADDD